MTIFSTSSGSASTAVPEPPPEPPDLASTPSVEPLSIEQEPIVQVTPPDSYQDMDELFRRIQRAHGGVDGGRSVLERSTSVVFRFTRHTPEGQTIDHLYARSGGSRHLVVEVSKGEGTSTQVGLTPEAAWSTGPDGNVPVDKARAIEAIERFSPEAVLGIALTAATDIETRPELQRLRLDGQTEVHGDRCEVLRYDGDRVVPPFVVAVSTSTWRVRQLGFDSGVLKEMADYHSTDEGLVFPRKMNIWRNRELIDTVEVSMLELGGDLPEAWTRNPFALPKKADPLVP